MASCSVCGKDLGFFASISGKKICDDCERAEKEKNEAKKSMDLAKIHDHFLHNLNATSPDNLQVIVRQDQSLQLFAGLAHSIKSNENVFVVSNATAKRLKYVKSQRYVSGVSFPLFGLKGFRVGHAFGESAPVYDLAEIGRGIMAITNKNVHLAAAVGKPLKIPYGKIEGFHLYTDGLEIHHGLKNPTLFVLKEVDPIQSDVIGHIIGLFTQE